MPSLPAKIACALLRLVPTGLPLPILRGPLRGRWWIAGAAAGPGKGLSILANASEPGQLARAAALARPQAVCFDIGANVGFYTLLFATRARQVYAFEPLPRNLRFLIRMTERNRLANACVVPCAMGAEPGIAFFAPGDNPAVGALDERGDLPVHVTTVDIFCQQTGAAPDIMKIDVEGAEMDVLRGAAHTIEARHPDILLSVHSNALRRECLEWLRQAGYRNFEPLDADDLAEADEFAVCA